MSFRNRYALDGRLSLAQREMPSFAAKAAKEGADGQYAVLAEPATLTIDGCSTVTLAAGGRQPAARPGRGLPAAPAVN